MPFRRHSLISQPGLPGMEVDPHLAWLRLRKRHCMQQRPKRPTAAEKRLEAARRDPRQVSIFGQEHTDDLTSR
jgi:hypothetical protein